jgi:hypothetical protein
MKLSKIFAALGLSILMSSCVPATQPSQTPTNNPTVDPTEEPTVEPTSDPSIDPTLPELQTILATQNSFTSTSGDIGGDSNAHYASYIGGGTATPIADDGYIRIYQAAVNSGSSIGGCITFSVDQGYIISAKIGSAMSTTVNYTLDDEVDFAATDYDLAADDIYSVSNLNNKEITFHCLGLDKTHRLYVNYIEIVYAYNLDY